MERINEKELFRKRILHDSNVYEVRGDRLKSRILFDLSEATGMANPFKLLQPLRSSEISMRKRKTLIVDQKEIIPCYLILDSIDGRKCAFFYYQGSETLYLVNLSTDEKSLYNGTILFGLYDKQTGTITIVDSPRFCGNDIRDMTLTWRLINLLGLWKLLQSKKIIFNIKSRVFRIQPGLWVSDDLEHSSRNGHRIVLFDDEDGEYRKCDLYLIK